MLFPVGLLIVQTYILLFGTLYLMKKMSVINTAVVDMDISHAVVASAFLFSVFFISTADYSPLMQTFKFLNNNEALYSATFYRFGQYFIDVLGGVIIFVLLVWVNIKIFLGGKGTYDEIKNGNVPLSLLIAVVTISFAVLTRYIVAEVIDYRTPKVVIFN